MNNLPQNIKRLRERQWLTHSTLAMRISRSGEYIELLEKGLIEEPLSLPQTIKLAKALNVTVSELLGEVGTCGECEYWLSYPEELTNESEQGFGICNVSCIYCSVQNKFHTDGDTLHCHKSHSCRQWKMRENDE